MLRSIVVAFIHCLLLGMVAVMLVVMINATTPTIADPAADCRVTSVGQWRC